MTVPGRYIFLAFAFALAFAMTPADAFATCLNCNRPQPPNCHQNCNPSPPPVVVVPPPYAPPPSVIVAGASANAQARASATSIAVANVRTGDVIIRNGGGYAGIAVDAGVSSMALAVSESEAAAETAFTVAAICLDATGVRHPAAQTFAEREVAESYVGEIFRCTAGARMRVTIDGRNMDCGTDEALWHDAGQLSCRPRIARRPSHERALLDRFGAGEKMVRLRAQRQAARETQFNSQMTMDGGVGQGVW